MDKFGNRVTAAIVVVVLLVLAIGMSQNRYRVLYTVYYTDVNGNSQNNKQCAVTYGWSAPVALDEAWEHACDVLPYPVDSIEINNLLCNHEE